MTFHIPAHKVVGDTGKPGQVVTPVYPTQLTVDVDLTKLEEDADDARRLRMLYDCLFYSPRLDSGV